MRERLIREWAHAPWHSWLKGEPAWLDLFAEFWARIPEQGLRRLFFSARALIVLPPVHCGRVVRITRPLPTGASILQLDEKLLERPREERLGILAHEVAHLCSPPADDPLQNDLIADRIAAAWGFAVELRLALARDLEDTHPRRVAAAQAAPSAA